MLLVSLEKLTDEKNEHCDKINQLLASQEMVMKGNNDLCGNTDWLQMLISSLFLSVPRRRIFSPAASDLKLQKIKLKSSL